MSSLRGQLTPTCTTQLARLNDSAYSDKAESDNDDDDFDDDEPSSSSVENAGTHDPPTPTNKRAAEAPDYAPKMRTISQEHILI